MIINALKRFKDKLPDINENYSDKDKEYLVELARRQLNSSNGFSFCQIHSNNEFLGRQLKTVHRQLKNISKAYIDRYNPGGLSWKEKLEFLVEAENNPYKDVVKIGYIKGKESTAYSLHPILLRSFLSCFFEAQNSLIILAPTVRPLRHIKSYEVAKKGDQEDVTTKAITKLHKKALINLETGVMDKESFTLNINALYQNSDNDIESMANCLAAIGCLQKLSQQGLSQTDIAEVYSYPLAYKVTGANHPRLVDRLPVQNLTSNLKENLYGAVECVNYDIKSSNFNMLEKLFRDAGLDTAWFREYLADPDGKREELIASTECTKKQVKKALQSVSNGAPFVSNTSTAIGRAFDTVDQGRKFIRELPNLKKSMKEFELLIKGDTKNRAFKSRGVWKNAIGMTCRFDQANSFGQICSFLVMGLEQKFILTLVSKLPDNIKVYTLMHDGFVCSEEIPEDLIDEVKIDCDLPYLIFEQQEGF